MKIYLIAKKLSHSFSPLIHEKLADYSYELKELDEKELDVFFEKRDFDGLNVTIPYKQTVMKYLSEISPEAERIGAVNTVLNDGGRLKGFNTDYYGFIKMLEKSGICLKGKNTVIIGNGGVAKMAMVAAGDMGASSVRVITRSENTKGKIDKYFDAEIIINATPVGMFPNNGYSPIELKNFKKCSAVCDLIYNPAKTRLLMDAERLGIKNTNGLSMLVAQAKKAAEIFKGAPVSDKKADEAEESVRLMTMNIILIGMPGCGKTTIGKLLAKKLGRDFYDTDWEIQKSLAHPADIIKERGEAFFRRLETEKCLELCKKSGIVIATGGGSVTVPENRDILRQNGYIIFINRPPEELATSNRPLSGGGGEKLRRLFETRLPLYRSFCDKEIRGAEKIEDTLELVLQASEIKKHF